MSKYITSSVTGWDPMEIVVGHTGFHPVTLGHIVARYGADAPAFVDFCVDWQNSMVAEFHAAPPAHVVALIDAEMQANFARYDNQQNESLERRWLLILQGTVGLLRRFGDVEDPVLYMSLRPVFPEFPDEKSITLNPANIEAALVQYQAGGKKRRRGSVRSRRSVRRRRAVRRRRSTRSRARRERK